MPAPEQVAPEPASRSPLQQAAAWSVAALITLAAAISVLLSKTVAGATASGCAGARDGEALAAPPRSATTARSRPGSCASGDDRSCCRGRSESPAHQGGITISSSFLGQLLVVRRLPRCVCGRRPSRFAAAARYQVRVRGHLGETPGPAAPSPDGATLAIVSRSGVADPSAANHFNEATLSHLPWPRLTGEDGGEPARPRPASTSPRRQARRPSRRETREPEEGHHAPLFVTLFIETDADDALTEQQDRKRRAHAARRGRSARAMKIATANPDRPRRT